MDLANYMEKLPIGAWVLYMKLAEETYNPDVYYSVQVHERNDKFMSGVINMCEAGIPLEKVYQRQSQLYKINMEVRTLNSVSFVTTQLAFT